MAVTRLRCLCVGDQARFAYTKQAPRYTKNADTEYTKFNCGYSSVALAGERIKKFLYMEKIYIAGKNNLQF